MDIQALAQQIYDKHGARSLLQLKTAFDGQTAPFTPEARCTLIEALITLGADIDAHLKESDDEALSPENEESVLHIAAALNDEAAVRILLKAGADMTAQDYAGATPFFYAARNERAGALNVMLEAGASVRETWAANAETPIHWAARSGSAACVKALVEAGADLNALNKRGLTLMHQAVSQWEEHDEVVKLLLSYGVSATQPDANGSTPLHLAALHGLNASATLLLVHHADPNATNKRGQTPLHYAMENHHASFAALLCEAGADVNAHDNDGETALHYGAGNVFCVRALCAAGADPNVAATDTGETPLYRAVWLNRVDSVRALLELGANPKLADKQETTPMDLALLNNYTECIDALKTN